MATVSKWSKVQVAIQSALDTALTITAITKANPAVVSYTDPGSADPAPGDVVLLAVQGMWQLDARAFKIGTVNQVANTFTLADEDSTLYDTFTSGTARVVTLGTNMTTAVGLTAAGGEFDFLDVTTIHDNVRKQVPGLSNAATYTFDNIWDVADAALIALKAASDNQDLRVVQFTFANGQKVLFNGYVGATLLPTGNAPDVVKTSVVVTMYGRPSVYAS